MAYRELIKNFEGIRSYMREFYVCGFKSREEYREKSARSYDNERRRIESWLGAYMSFRQDASSKTVFLFKHHYILRALDSDVLCDLLLAIDQRRAVELEVRNPRTGCDYQRTVCPLKIYISTQSGRQYLLGYKYRGRRMAFFRLDAIRQVKPGCLDEQYGHLSQHAGEI